MNRRERRAARAQNSSRPRRGHIHLGAASSVLRGSALRDELWSQVVAAVPDWRSPALASSLVLVVESTATEFVAQLRAVAANADATPALGYVPFVLHDAEVVEALRGADRVLDLYMRALPPGRITATVLGVEPRLLMACDQRGQFTKGV